MKRKDQTQNNVENSNEYMRFWNCVSGVRFVRRQEFAKRWVDWLQFWRRKTEFSSKGKRSEIMCCSVLSHMTTGVCFFSENEGWEIYRRVWWAVVTLKICIRELPTRISTGLPVILNETASPSDKYQDNILKYAGLPPFKSCLRPVHYYLPRGEYLPPYFDVFQFHFPLRTSGHYCNLYA
jgi:hypothetical protein